MKRTIPTHADYGLYQMGETDSRLERYRRTMEHEDESKAERQRILSDEEDA